MGRSLWLRVYGQLLNAHFALGFPAATLLWSLTLQLTITRRIIKQKARRHTFENALRLLVGL